MPFGGYKDFETCVLKNKNKKNPEAYCGYIKNKVEGANAMEDKMVLSTADLMDAAKEIADASPIPASSAQTNATFKETIDGDCPAGKARDPKTGKCVPCPGSKIRSKGQGRGLGIGNKKGPIGRGLQRGPGKGTGPIGRGRGRGLETAESELSMGKKIEKEHQPTYDKIKNGMIKTNKEMFKGIASDHLKEFSKYYTGLKGMEKKLKSEKKETAEDNKEVDRRIDYHKAEAKSYKIPYKKYTKIRKEQGLTLDDAEANNSDKDDMFKNYKKTDYHSKYSEPKKKDNKGQKTITEFGKKTFASYADGLRENTEEMIRLTHKANATTERINQASRTNALGNPQNPTIHPNNMEDYAFAKAERERANIMKQISKKRR